MNITSYFIQERVDQIDQDFLEFEIENIDPKDLEKLDTLLSNLIDNKGKFDNPHNSILLYITGLSNQFDLKKARSDMRGGSPPDIDLDLGSTDREIAVNWLIEKYGRDQVGNIAAYGTLGPKSILRNYYRVTEGNSEEAAELRKLLPAAKFGKEATIEQILTEVPDLDTNPRYKGYVEVAKRLQDMICIAGVHAAGIVISNDPIHEHVPLWKNSDFDRITQFDKDEVQTLGLLKFDLLAIDTLSIIKSSLELIKQNYNLNIDIYNIPDGDTKAYAMMNSLILAGVFQMETSGAAAKLIEKVQPHSIEELSDISALMRPGPAQAGLPEQYVENKASGQKPDDMPDIIAEVLKDTNFTLIYQETLMELCGIIGDFSLRDTDDIRRALGHKQVEVLEPYKEQFISHGIQKNLDEKYLSNLWEDLLGFADYCLAGETLVCTKEFGNISIEEIVKHQLACTVFSVLKDNIIVEQTIEQWHNNGNQLVYEYKIQPRDKLGRFMKTFKVKCTPDHKFMINTGEMFSIDSIYNDRLELHHREV